MRESCKVVQRNLPGPEVVDRHSFFARHIPCARVGRLARMPVARPRAVRLGVEPDPLGLGAEGGFGQRRATDIADAHEQHPKARALPVTAHRLSLSGLHLIDSSIPLPKGSSAVCRSPLALSASR